MHHCLQRKWDVVEQAFIFHINVFQANVLVVIRKLVFEFIFDLPLLAPVVRPFLFLTVFDSCVVHFFDDSGEKAKKVSSDTGSQNHNENRGYFLLIDQTQSYLSSKRI